MIVVVDPLFCGMPLVDALARLGYRLNTDCGGMGKCGKCKVKLVDGTLSDRSGNIIYPSDTEILACGVVCSNMGATVELFSFTDDQINVKFSSPCEDECAVAVDLGTTAIEVALVDRKNGKIAARASANNPQYFYGADVMSRITAANDRTALDNMRQITLEKIESMIKTLCHDKMPTDGVLSGNTTMTSMVCGVSPRTIGTAPFKLPFSESREVFLENSGITLKTLPLSSAFIGGDVLVGAALLDIDKTDTPTLFADLGTNGEIILSANGKLLAASAAAGPALEGAGISCGMIASDGAVRSVSCIPNGKLLLETVGNKPPRGIAASGLFDLVAVLLEMGDITQSGEFLRDPYTITADISITADDVRAFMFAKAAFRAAIETLLDAAGINARDITRFFVAGGISEHLNRFSAAKIGLFPPELAVIAKAVGNSSLYGSARAACDEHFFEKVSNLSKKIVTISLADSSFFGERFICEMSFPQMDDL